MQAIVIKKKILIVAFLLVVIGLTGLFVFSQKRISRPVPKAIPTVTVSPTPNVVYIVLTPTPEPTASPSATPTRAVIRRVSPVPTALEISPTQ